MNRKLDPAAHKVIFRVLASGGTIKNAADAVGCNRSTIYAAGQREPEFRKTIEELQSQSKHKSLITLADAAKSNGQLAYKRLRMLYPDDYARKAATIPVKQARQMLVKITNAVKSARERESRRDPPTAV